MPNIVHSLFKEHMLYFSIFIAFENEEKGDYHL